MLHMGKRYYYVNIFFITNNIHFFFLTFAPDFYETGYPFFFSENQLIFLYLNFALIFIVVDMWGGKELNSYTRTHEQLYKMKRAYK